MTLNHTAQQPTANNNNRYGEAGKCPVSLSGDSSTSGWAMGGNLFYNSSNRDRKRCRVPWNVVDKQLTYTWNASVFPQSTDTGQTRWDFFCLFLGNTKSKCGTCCWRTPEERDNKSLIVYFLHLTALSVINNHEKMKGVKATKLTKLVRGRRWWNTPW